MNFTIGQQSAAIINNVTGDQRVEGGQHGTAVTGVTVQQARRAVGDLWAGLAAARLDETVAPPVRAQLAAVEAAVRAPEPNQSRVADALRRFTRLLVAAGSLLGRPGRPVAGAGRARLGPGR